MYLNNWPRSVHVMLSAIDSEMDRCFAELRFLNFGAEEEKSAIDSADCATGGGLGVAVGDRRRAGARTR